MMSSGPIRWVRRLLPGRELDCEDVRSLSSEYVEDTLKESIASNFRRHLEGCQNCSTFVATFRATVLTLRDLPRRSAPPELREKLHAQFKLD